MTLYDKTFITEVENRLIRMLSESRRHLFTDSEIQSEIKLLNQLKGL